MNASLTCRDGAGRLMDYLDGVLDEAQARAIEVHVAGCVHCTAFVRSYTAVPVIMREATSATLSESGRLALRRALLARRR